MTSQVWPLGYFREAEVRSADLLQQLLRRTDDPELQIDLTRQLADEARHIQLLSELILELGGPLTSSRKGYRHHLHRKAGIPSTILGLLALTQVVEERVQQRYCAYVQRSGEDPRILETLHTIAADEGWHLIGIKDCLGKLEKMAGRTRVAATLDYYRRLEAKAYMELIAFPP